MIKPMEKQRRRRRKKDKTDNKNENSWNDCKLKYD